MCGICGVWYFDPARRADAALLARMTAVIAHRGPDEEGFHIDGSLALGFRRLSIIDLSGSHQPMSNEDGSAWLVFNGEIYNFQELRAGLVSRHQFRTSGDTEVILHSYEETGADCVRAFRGMFAAAIWDQTKQRMTLAVDRFGKKPLYYLRDEEKLLFGSELKCLLLHPGLRLEIDPEALDEFLSCGYIAAPRTIFKTIRKLPPAHTLTADAHGRGVPLAYWEPSLAVQPFDRARSEDDLASELRSLLDEAVRLRMISDVPLGAFLSGGIDSSAIVALMARHSNRPVKTFSIGFDEEGYDESPFAAEVARHCHTEHVHEVVRPDVVDILPKLARQFDEPFADNSMIPSYYVSRMARQQVTVALSGDGGDEVFGGYQWYRRAYRQVLLQRLIPESLHPLGAFIGARLPKAAKLGSYLAALEQPITHLGLSRDFFDHEQRLQLYLPALREQLGQFDSGSLVNAALEPARDLPWLSQLQYLDLVRYMPADILVKVDRASMLASLEVRSPLLDHRVFEFMARVSPDLKLNGRQSKVLLRRAIGDLLPEGILARRKRGFDLPMGAWLSGPLQPMLRDLLLEPSARVGRWFDRGVVRQLVEDHSQGRAEHQGRLWSLLCLELWAREYLSHTGS